MSDPALRFVYRPHPRVVAARRGSAHETHLRITELVERAQRREPTAGHTVSLSGPIAALFAGTDLLIGDVSSVVTDFLLVRPQVPLLLTDRHEDREEFVKRTPLARAADVIDTADPAQIRSAIARSLDRDPWRAARVELRDYYFAVPVGHGIAALHERILAEVL